MTEMNAAFYYDKNDIRIEETPKPVVKGDEVLVVMKACGICGSDLMDWYIRPRAPIVLGHEPAGIIEKKGRHVTDFNVGDRVFVHHHVPCMKCHYCLRGDFTLCEQFHNTSIIPGGFAESFKVPRLNLKIDTLKIPDGMSDEEATFIEPMGCCLRALQKCGVQMGDTVAVLGCGVTGIIHIKLSKLLGASTVVASDLFDNRLRIAKEFGADLTVNAQDGQLRDAVRSMSDGRGADVVIVTAPNLVAYANGMSACRKGGRLCVFAPTEPGKILPVSPNEIFFSEVKIIPSYSTSHVETREALEIIKNKKVDVQRLVTHRFVLADAAEAFRTAREDTNSLKIVLLGEV